MSIEVERLLVVLEARMGQYMTDLNKAQAQTNRQFGAIEARYAGLEKSIKSSVGSIGAVLGTLGTYLTADQLIGYANAWLRVERSVQAGAEVFGVALLPAERLNALANDARIDVEAYSKTYVRTAAAIRDYGFAAGTAENVTSTLAKALKLGSASASEQASTILQFSQALQKGKLDGDEFRTVMENAGVVQELLADRLKVSKGEIIKMAAEGKLKIRDLVGAMVDGGEKIERIFKQVPITTDEAWTVLNNSVIQYVGHLDKTYGITSSMVGITAALARNVETIGDAALVLGAGFLAAFAPGIIAGATGLAVAIVAMAGPIGILVGLVAAAAAGVELFGDKMKISEDHAFSLKDAVHGLAEAMTDGQTSTAGFESTMHGFGLEAEETGAKVEGLIEKTKRLAEAAAIQPKLAGFAGQLKSYLDGTFKDPPALKKGIKPTDGDEKTKRNAYEREIESIRKRIEATQAELKVVGESAAAQERARTQQSLLTAARQAEINLTPEHLAAIDELARRYGAAAGELAYLNALQGARDNNEALQREIDLIGKTGVELHRARIEQELLNEAKRAGVAITPDRAAEIAAEARKGAALTQTLETMREIESVSKDALKGFISDLREGKSAGEALSGVLDKIADKLFEVGIDQLVGASLGGSGGAGGLGASLSKIFGFANGGVMVPGQGPRQLRRCAKGGTSNTAAIFGEAGPEAAVPLPDGRSIPVDLRAPKMQNAAPGPSGGAGNGPVELTINMPVQNGTPEGVEKMKAQLVPTIVKTVNELFDRSPRFRKAKL